MRKVSVCLLSYGQWNYTQLCLEYLLNGLNGYPIDEFLIVDTPEDLVDFFCLDLCFLTIVIRIYTYI